MFLPFSSISSLNASSISQAFLYGLVDVRASNTSTIAVIRPKIGIFSP